MPATGFTRLAAGDLPAAHQGRLWRVTFRDGTAASQGNKTVRSIVVDDHGVVVRDDTGRTRYGFEAVESVLIEESPPVQRTISAWGGG